MYFADMHLEIFLADFAVFRVFWGISRKYLNFAGPRPRELSEALTMVSYYEMIQIIEMFETTDRFVKQTPHTLYLTLEKLNAEKAVRFPRRLQFYVCTFMITFRCHRVN